MTATALSPEYAIANAPTVIRSDEQNEHYIRLLWELEHKKRLTSKEARLAELLTLLITDYEEKHYQLRSRS